MRVGERVERVRARRKSKHWPGCVIHPATSFSLQPISLTFLATTFLAATFLGAAWMERERERGGGRE
jgi:hypothetical protein